MNRAITPVLVIDALPSMTAAIGCIALPSLNLAYLFLIVLAVAIGIVFIAIIALQTSNLNDPLAHQGTPSGRFFVQRSLWV